MLLARILSLFQVQNGNSDFGPILRLHMIWPMNRHCCYPLYMQKTREGDPVRPCNFHKKHYFSESPLIHNTRQSKMQRYEMAEHET